MPYHKDHFLGELYAEVFARQPRKGFTINYAPGESTTTANTVIPENVKPFSTPWLSSIPDKICKCGQKNECYHVFCWKCGDKLND